MSWTWAEPFAGAAAVALRLAGGRDLTPPVAWMGGKRRYARAIADAMGVPAGRPSRVLLADAGPWGWVWPLLLDPTEAARVAIVLRSWQGEHPRDLWQRLASEPPFRDVYQRAAQWLWLQARSASGVPIWWDGWRFTVDGRNAPQSTWGRYGDDNAGRWKQDDHDTGRSQGATQTGGDLWLASDGQGVARPAGQKSLGAWEQGSGNGRPPQPAGQRGTWRMGKSENRDSDQPAWQKGQAHGRTGGIVNPATIAERIEAIALAFGDIEVYVHHGTASDMAPEQGFALLDPPYVGATGYGWDCPRDEVLALARAWEAAGAVVAISEAESLPIQGWYHLELTRPGGKPEWLTLSREPVRVPERQLGLFP